MAPTATDELSLTLAPYGADPETGQAYPPHPTQENIRQWAREVRAGQHAEHGIPVLYLQHGVNAGGTRGVLTPAIEYLLETPGLNVLIGRKDFADLRLSGMETFFRIIPPELIAEQNVQEHRYVIRAQGGSSTVFFRELKDTKGLGSQEFAVIVVIEAHELSLSMYRTLKQRCRQGQLPSLMLLEGNPPTEGHWLTNLCNPTHPDYDPSLQRITLTSKENWNYMTEAYRKDLEQMPPMWFRRFVMAEVGGLPDGTPVYPAFIERLHVQDTALIPDRPMLRFWDFGLRATACLWAQQEDAGRLLVHREWCPHEVPETAFIEGVIQRTNLWYGERACKDFGDPAATHRDPEGIATLTRLQQQRIRLIYRQTTYGDRIPLINKKFCELIHGQPAIVVSPLCRTLIEGLSGGYHYPTLDEGDALTTRRDQPFHDAVYSHPCNAFEYGMVNLYLPTSPAGQAKRQAESRRIREQLEGAVGTAIF